MSKPTDSSPHTRPPLGTFFVLLLHAPVACIGLVAVITLLSGPAHGLSLNRGHNFALILFLLTLFFMLVCSIILAERVGRRSGVGMGILALLGILGYYAAVAYAGCAFSMSIA